MSENSAQPEKSNALLVSLTDATDIVGLTVWRLRGLIANRELPIIKVGRKFYLRRSTLIRWAERAEALRGS